MPNISLFDPGFSVALCLVVFSFLMPLFSRELRKSGSIMCGYWFVLSLHQIVAFLNIHLLVIEKRGTFGASDDANFGFHQVAKELALRGEMHYRGQDLWVPLSLDSFFKGFPRPFLLPVFVTCLRRPGDPKFVNLTGPSGTL